MKKLKAFFVESTFSFTNQIIWRDSIDTILKGAAHCIACTRGVRKKLKRVKEKKREVWMMSSVQIHKTLNADASRERKRK